MVSQCDHSIEYPFIGLRILHMHCDNMRNIQDHVKGISQVFFTFPYKFLIIQVGPNIKQIQRKCSWSLIININILIVRFLSISKENSLRTWGNSVSIDNNRAFVFHSVPIRNSVVSCSSRWLNIIDSYIYTWSLKCISKYPWRFINKNCIWIK